MGIIEPELATDPRAEQIDPTLDPTTGDADVQPHGKHWRAKRRTVDATKGGTVELQARADLGTPQIDATDGTEPGSTD